MKLHYPFFLLMFLLSACQLPHQDMSRSVQILSTPPNIASIETEVTIPLEADNEGHLYLNAEFQGKRLVLLVDTGAQIMVFSNTLLQGTSIKTEVLADGLLGGMTGPGKGTVGFIPVLSIDKVIISRLPVLFVDLDGWNRRSVRSGARKIDGFLGSNMLLYLRAEIDYKKSQLTVSLPRT